MRISSYFAYVLLAAFAFLTGCATNPVTGESQIMLISGSQERALGLEADKGVREEYGVYDNPALQAYVNDIGQKLAAQSQRAGLDWKFTVVDSPEINAFALPGGFIYITRGLMAYLDNEAELAGVLGHEIGHVTARHGVEQQSKGLLVGLGGVALELLTGVSGVSDLTSSLATVGYLLPKSREHELQADQLGAEYLSRTNYNPDSMVKVIEVLKLQEQFANDQSRNKATRAERLPNWLSTHPSNDQRLSQIEVIAN
ncbi:MAG: M48 family metalloprotease, partial [Betaproteobacteria bacterium]|nr:M48 family metalloprotease [Betaproteobacteria bacterium]